MLTSGISLAQALEVTAEVVDNKYRDIILTTLSDVKGGQSFADSISQYPEIPGILNGGGWRGTGNYEILNLGFTNVR